MTFQSMSFKQRFGVMGDEAESVFEAVHSDGKWSRTGLSRPPFRMSDLPGSVRNTPDYLMGGHWVECLGLGKDQRFKLKVLKFHDLMTFDPLHPVNLFVWDSHKKRWTMFGLREWVKHSLPLCQLKQFHDGPVYFDCAADHLPGAWIDHTIGVS